MKQKEMKKELLLRKETYLQKKKQIIEESRLVPKMMN